MAHNDQSIPVLYLLVVLNIGKHMTKLSRHISQVVVATNENLIAVQSRKQFYPLRGLTPAKVAKNEYSILAGNSFIPASN